MIRRSVPPEESSRALADAAGAAPATTAGATTGATAPIAAAVSIVRREKFLPDKPS
ncbi:hypothetical protein GCM10027521_50290 [Amycolatopsis cihanbeyliensis]